MRLLVIEDNVTQAESLGLVLKNKGHLAFLAGDIQAAKDQLASHPVDAVLLDLTLPSGDGREFLDWLRRQPSVLRLLPVVVTSAWPRDELEDLEGLESVTLLPKPFSPEELIAELHVLGVKD